MPSEIFFSRSYDATIANSLGLNQKIQLAITFSKLTIETTEQRHQWHRSGVVFANYEHISLLVPVFQ